MAEQYSVFKEQRKERHSRRRCWAGATRIKRRVVWRSLEHLTSLGDRDSRRSLDDNGADATVRRTLPPAAMARAECTAGLLEFRRH